MNVLELSHEYPPFIFGGVGSFVETLSLELAKAGVNVEVLCAGLNPADSFDPKCSANFKGGLHVTRIPIPDIPSRNLWFQTCALKRMKKLLRDADIVHAHTFFHIISAANLPYKKTWVTTIHGLPIRTFQASMSRPSTPSTLIEDFHNVTGFPYIEAAHRIDLGISSHLVFVANHVLKDAVNLYGRKIEAKSSTIWAPVSDLAFSVSTNSVQPKTDFTFGFVGRLTWLKGILLLLDAFDLLTKMSENAKLRIYGRGPLEAEIRNRIRAPSTKGVELVGWIPRSKLLPELIREVDAVVLPSLQEACPISLLEGMALGKPTISSMLPWGREFTEDGKTGLLSKLGAKELAAKMLLLVKDHKLCVRLGTNARSFVASNFTPEKIARAYSNLFADLT